MKRGLTVWDDHDTQFVALVALRYCYYRQTYAPSLVCEWVRRHWPNIHHTTRRQMIEDLQGEFDMCKRSGFKMGADFDHRDWVAFLNWMEENENA